MSKRELVYLAIPYTFNGEKSFEVANRVAAELMKDGNIVFSPISHSHPIADHLDDNLRYSQDFWMAQDLPILSKCDKMALVVIGEDGFNLISESKGCTAEYKQAEILNIPIEFYLYTESLTRGETTFDLTLLDNE